MILHPDIEALRVDDGPQRRAQAAMCAAMDLWRVSPEGAALLAELERLGTGGGALCDQPLLADCFRAGSGAAEALVRGLVSAQLATLVQQPLGHVAMRHFTDGMLSTLLIARSGKAALSLVAVDGAAHARRPAPTTISLAPNYCIERVLAGNGIAEQVVCTASGPTTMTMARKAIRLARGSVLQRDALREALLLGKVRGTLVVLRLQLAHDTVQPAREYALADGRLLGQAASSAHESRIELAAALLGRMARADAAPLLAEMAQQAGPEALRWQALRECLALDTGAGFAALSAVAAAADDPLAVHAGALRAQLIETHPQLAVLA